MITEGCQVLGEVENSVLFPGVYIGEGAKVKDSIIMPYARVGANAVIAKAIIGRKSVVEDGAQLGVEAVAEQEASRWFSGITLIGDNITITSETKIKRNALLTHP
jgi:glucose-1-phosphate adenylyltransferase